MKVYVVIELYTPDERGATTRISECEVFKTEEEAVKYVRYCSGGREPEKNEISRYEKYNLEYCTDWYNNEIRFSIQEKEIRE